MLTLFLIGAPIVFAVVSALSFKRTSIIEMSAVIATTIELVIATRIAYLVSQNGSYSTNAYLSFDALGILIALSVAIIGFATALYSIGYLREEVKKGIIGFRRVRQYFILVHFFLAAMFLAVATTNPIIMWVAIEATTLSTAFLISFYNRPTAVEAGWKYLIINSVGLLLGFFGTLLFFTATRGATSGEIIDWNTLLSLSHNLDPFIAKMAFIIVLIGFGTKIGFVPMHTWKPDAYSKAPTPIIALFSGALLNVAFLAVLRFKVVADSVLQNNFTDNLFIFFGLLSIVVSALIIFTQGNYKRLFAYSSIEHAGIIALGFGFGGVGIFGAVLHMLYHALAKSSIFFSLGNIFLKYGTTKIEIVKALLQKCPVTATTLFLGFLAVSGIPPFGTFVTEFSILSAGFAEHPAIVIITLTSLSLVFAGMLRHFSAMAFSKEEGKAEYMPEKTSLLLVLPTVFLISIVIVFSVYIPETFKTLLDASVVTLQQ